MPVTEDLTRVIAWAEERICSGTEPAWSFYRLMQLKESACELRRGMQATEPPERSQELPGNQESEPSPSAVVLQLDAARRLAPQTYGWSPQT